MEEIEIPDVVDIEWARKEMERTGKKNCNKDFVYYVMRGKRYNNRIDWIDLNDLPKSNNKINWKLVNNKAPTKLGEEFDAMKIMYIKHNNNGDAIVEVKFKNKFKNIKIYQLQKVALSDMILEQDNHVYQVGEIVNDSLRIVSKIRKGGNNLKAYKVQSIMYPDAPLDIVLENNLKRGQKDAYETRQKIYEGNSLFSVKHARPYLVNIEESKTVAPNTSKTKIMFKCPECKIKKQMTPNNFMNRGFNCSICGIGNSISQNIVRACLYYKKLNFKEEQLLEGAGRRRFDFVNYDSKTIIEVQGSQHYDKNNSRYDSAHQQDLIKREFCKNNGWNLIELDCRNSSFTHVINSFNKNKLLPRVKSNEETYILDLLENTKRYPVLKMKKMYDEGYKLSDIAKEINRATTTVSNIFKRHGYQVRKAGKTPDNRREVVCINTGEKFISLKKAAEWCGLKGSAGISYVCDDKRKTAGKHPKTGESLRWEDVEDQDENNTYSNNEENLHIA